MKLRYLLILALLLSACGEATDDSGTPESDTVNLADSPSDSLTDRQLRVRADGMTIWAESRVEPANDWRFQARSSHSLAKISASVAGEEAKAELISARKFEVFLTARQLENNLGELPLLVNLETKSGKTFTVMMQARARFMNTTGSSKIYPWRTISPIMVGRERVFRGTVTTPDNIVFVGGWNDDDSEPQVHQADATHWHLDWYPGTLAWSAHPTEDALDIVADTATGKRYRRWSPIYMDIVRLGVTNQSASDVWPLMACESAVRTCVRGYDVAADDMSACGSAAEVASCLAEIPVDDTPVWKKRFASDLRSKIIAHYRVNEADIIASGGNTRPQALLSVDTRDIDEVVDEDDNPTGHSLDDHRIFSHPDITFPGSDIVWLGVYERATGNLVAVSDFN